MFMGFDTIGLWFQAANQNRQALVPRFAGFIAASVIKVSFILGAVSYKFFAVTQTVDALLSGAAIYFAYRARGRSLRLAFQPALARVLILETVPYLLSGLAVTAYMRVDQLLIQYFLGYQAVGNYAAAVPLSNVWFVIPTTLQIVLAPYIARAKLRGEAEYRQAFVYIFRSFGVLSLLLAIGTTLAAPTLVFLVYGERYDQAPHILAILAFSNFFVFQGVAQQIWIVNERAGALTFWRTASGMFASVVANLILLPWIGLPGAAIAALVSYGTSSMFSNIILCPEILWMQLGFHPLRNGRPQ